jgi:hypothetical protein
MHLYGPVRNVFDAGRYMTCEVGGWGWRWKSQVLWAPVKWHEPIGECYLGSKNITHGAVYHKVHK